MENQYLNQRNTDRDARLFFFDVAAQMATTTMANKRMPPTTMYPRVIGSVKFEPENTNRSLHGELSPPEPPPPFPEEPPPRRGAMGRNKRKERVETEDGHFYTRDRNS